MAKHRNMPAMAAPSYDEPERALRKQSRRSNDPWEPGEIPAGMNMTIRPKGARGRYGERSAVEMPANRGDRPTVDD